MSAASVTPFSLVPNDDRPCITIDVDVDRMCTQAIRALADDDDTFQRGSLLVHVAHVERGDVARRHRLPVGAAQIVEMTRSTLVRRLSRAIRWVSKSKKGDWKDARPDGQTCASVLDAKVWPNVRALVGITDAPMLRRDGTVMQTPGYDAATGYVYLPTDQYPVVLDEPTQADAQDALVQLLEPLADFPFAAEAHRFVLLAELATVLARTAIDGAIPCFGHDASTRGSGKTLAADVVSLLCLGRAGRATYSDEPEELRKVLDGYAMAGTRLVVIDNVTGPIDSAALNAYVTAHETIDIRVLGRTGQQTVPWSGVVVLTGNNLDPRGDLVRRMLIARLEPADESPERRSGFRHADLRHFVSNARPRLVAAMLTLLRAYCLAGRPHMGLENWGSFESWARLIPHALVWAGGANVLDVRAAADADVDPETMALSTVLAQLIKLGGGRPLLARDVVARLYPDRHPGEPATMDGFDDLRDALDVLCRCRPGQAPTSKQLGEMLRRSRGRWLDGRQLTAVHDKDKNAASWLVVSKSPPRPAT